MVMVIVSNDLIMEGHELQTNDKDVILKYKYIHKSGVPENAIANMDQLVGRVSVGVIPKGTVITKEFFLLLKQIRVLTHRKGGLTFH